MHRARFIPCLLLAYGRLVKTTRFAEPAYIGDPINTVAIFNDLRADEIMLLDIRATVDGTDPDIKYLSEVAEEATVPLSYGGGIRTLEQVHQIFAAGCEKIVLGTKAGENPDFVTSVSRLAGSQAVVVSVDVRRTNGGKSVVFVRSGTQSLETDAVTHARRMVDAGAGELLLHSIDREGTMSGFDTELIREVAESVTVPVIACGGAASRSDMAEIVKQGHVQAAAAGNIFVYQKANRSVLINYPERFVKDALLA